MPIHTFGDSHSINGWDSDIIKHHLGPVLCYSCGKEKRNRCNIKNFGVKSYDTVIFCFGEIDCRCHVQKHITNDKSYKMIIDEIVHNYIDAVKDNVDNCRVKNICIYNIPPTPQKHEISGQDKAKFPLLGTDEERKLYGIYFNKCLKDKCQENNWIFFDIYESYVDKNGFLNTELSDGNVHIRDGIFLKQFINAYLL